MRIGVFGGTFDPPHVGHLLLAADAREALQLDRLIFIPAGAQPFKVGMPPVASGQDRLEMVRLAVADDANYAVDDAEINRQGLSYTVDTLEHLAERFKGAQLFLLMGQDALAGFPQWRNPERIRELATLAAMERSGTPGPRSEVAAEGVVPCRRGGWMCLPPRSESGGVQKNRSRDSCPKASNGSSKLAGSIVETEESV